VVVQIYLYLGFFHGFLWFLTTLHVEYYFRFWWTILVHRWRRRMLNFSVCILRSTTKMNPPVVHNHLKDGDFQTLAFLKILILKHDINLE